MKLKCSLYTEDGGKTWFIGDVFYLADNSIVRSQGDNFLDSSEFEGKVLVLQ